MNKKWYKLPCMICSVMNWVIAVICCNHLMITADHGNDPVHHGTDHTREFVPLLVHFKGIDTGEELPLRQTFADIGATISDNFSVKMPTYGTSFLNSIVKKD